MKSYISDTIRGLLELHTLEERLKVFPDDAEQVADTKRQIESLRSSLSPKAVQGHDRFRGVGKRSVAEVRRGVCSGCHMGMATGLLADLKRGENLCRCENCGRFLYLVEEEAADQPAPRKKAKRLTVTPA